MRFALPIVTALGFCCATAQLSSQQLAFPPEFAPLTLGKALAVNFSESSVQGTKVVVYPEVCTWYGSLKFAEASNDKVLLEQLRKRFDDLLVVDNQARVPNTRHVDLEVFGVIPLELYRQTGKKRYLEMGIRFADLQWKTRRPTVFPPKPATGSTTCTCLRSSNWRRFALPGKRSTSIAPPTR